MNKQDETRKYRGKSIIVRHIPNWDLTYAGKRMAINCRKRNFEEQLKTIESPEIMKQA